MAKHTVLFSEHQAAQANMIDFAGWDMPLHYGSQLVEHQQVRSDVGMFDVSHMGIIDIIGPAAHNFLSLVLANNINKLTVPGSALYSCMLNPAGGVLDDLIVYYRQANSYRLIVNAATSMQDLAWLEKNARGMDLRIILQSSLAIIAVQGPESVQAISSVFSPDLASAVASLNKFSFVERDDYFIARTGYTGEDGFEIVIPASKAVAIWQKLQQHGVMPIGLGARDSLRLEAGYNLYGLDMDESVSPLESNLAWTVDLKTTDREFIGKRALLEQVNAGIPRHLVAIILEDRGVLRHGQKIMFSDQERSQEIGIVTSGGFSPKLQMGIGFARVEGPILAKYWVEIRGKKHAVRVTKAPFI